MRKVEGDKGGGAGGVGGHARALQAKSVGHAADQEAQPMARDGVGI